MAEELKHLIDTIKKKGVEKAEAEAEKIISDAKQKALEIVEEATKKADGIRVQAERDAAVFQERANIELQHAARDVLISLARGIERLLRESVKESVSEALSPETLKEILIKIGQIYFDKSLTGKPSDLFLNEEDASSLADFFKTKLRHMMEDGLVVHTDDRITRGFAIGFRNQRFYHDFTQEAITEELCRFLQPRMEEIVRSVVSEEKEKE
jgi:V/A-type H+-transporting ATPase subunit E